MIFTNLKRFSVNYFLENTSNSFSPNDLFQTHKKYSWKKQDGAGYFKSKKKFRNSERTIVRNCDEIKFRTCFSNSIVSVRVVTPEIPGGREIPRYRFHFVENRIAPLK